MKAVVCTEYGSPEVLQVKEVEKPSPKENEVLVNVKATTVNYGDLAARRFRYITRKEFHMTGFFWLMAKISFGLKKPKIQVFGSEFSGVVESVGNKVTKFRPGDAVFGYVGQSMGAYAEYLCLPETGTIAIKPEELSFEEAAAIPYGSIMALSLLRKMEIKPGQKVLVNGASGGIGAAAVQIAKHFKADVTGVCGTPRLEYVRSLGADRVIDYIREDFTQNGEKYDLIVDVLGKCAYSQCKNSLTPNGRILYASFKTKKLLQSVGNSRVVCALAPGSLKDLLVVKGMVEDGKIKAIIDRTFPMEQAAEAHRYVEEGKKTGSVVIVIE
ncbi:MAG TPA: NAD(P)-dependent alcohol dehydrogenase [Prolixibacteraceae bacterium]|nr:NAD(P)-dependent alcohol dehydrogenase [Prolixibacteraceae bacterium]HPS12319.1 NAD(P)-dependent alcohol dehydrogenase [Prolixibacteraceae bacterium]